MVDSHKWFTNGDHPEDGCKLIDSTDGGEPFLSEGKVVRRFRNPEVPGDTLCPHCYMFFHMHGWIDKQAGGQMVCPGDVIVKNDSGEWEVFRKDWEYDTRVDESAVPCEAQEEALPVKKKGYGIHITKDGIQGNFV